MPKIERKVLDLIKDGPIIGLCIYPPRAVAEFLQLQGKSVPFRHISALIDTGSTTTAIDDKIAQELGLIHRDVGKFGTTGGIVEQFLYDLQAEITLDNGEYIGSIEIQSVGINLESQNCFAIIGRDLLQHAKFVYDGRKNKYSLEF